MSREGSESAGIPPAGWGGRWSLFLRIVALAIWVVAVDLWLARHFRSGVGFDQLLKFVGVPAVSVLAGGVLGFLLDDDEQKTLRAHARRLILLQLSAPLLVLLYVVAALAGAFRSTLTVIAADETESREMAVTSVLRATPSGDPVTLAAGEALDVGLWINPFAPEYRLAIDGYLPKLVSVKPYVGTTVVPARDLVRLPTLLFRPTHRGFELLENGGRLTLLTKQSGKFTERAVAIGSGSRYAGPRRAQPAGLAIDWRLDAQARHADEAALAKWMKWWRHPAAFEPAIALDPGEIVCALIASVDGRIGTGTVSVIGTDEYIDILIEDLGSIEDLERSEGTEEAEHEGTTSRADSVAVCDRLDRVGR